MEIDLKFDDIIKCPECRSVGNPVDYFSDKVKKKNIFYSIIDFLIFPAGYFLGHNEQRYRTGMTIRNKRWYCAKCGWEIFSEDKNLNRSLDKKIDIIKFIVFCVILFGSMWLISLLIKFTH
jgi:hypothetical protein